MSETQDCNGNVLNDGDTVTVIKDLKIKGMKDSWKRGQKVKSIRLTDDPEQIEVRLGRSTVILLTCYVKKA